MKLILIRHSEKVANKDMLTQKGKVQSNKLGKYLLDQKIDTIFCSPCLRCQQTLEAILDAGSNPQSIHFSKLIRLKQKSENFIDIKKRINLFIQDLFCEHSDNLVIAVVTHQQIIKMFSYQLTTQVFDIDFASVSIFEIKTNSAITITQNNTSFLS